MLLFYAGTWLWGAPKPNSYLDLHLKVEEKNKKIEELEVGIERFQDVLGNLFYQSRSSFVLRRITPLLLERSANSFADISELLDDICAPLYQQGGRLLGLKGDESWTFAVYLFSKQENNLIPVWRKESSAHPRTGGSRSWRPGQGHVGKAFADNEVIITPDANRVDVSRLAAAPPTLKRPYDDAYVSYAAVPFGENDSDQDWTAKGVFVATSNYPGRYGPENGELIAHFADTIGLIATIRNLDPDPFVDQNAIAAASGIEEESDA